MFFFRRKNKNKPIPDPVPLSVPEGIVYYLGKERYIDDILLSLSHSSSDLLPENADKDDFTAISREILEEVFSNLWVSAWIRDGNLRDYILPDGQRCEKKRSFSQAFQQYAKQGDHSQVFLANNQDDIVLFSNGFPLLFFLSYMSDISEDFFDREMYFYGYKQPFDPSNCYDEEERRSELSSWDIHAFFDELHDNLLLFIKDPHEAERIASLVRQACNRYGKELRMINSAGDSV